MWILGEYKFKWILSKSFLRVKLLFRIKAKNLVQRIRSIHILLPLAETKNHFKWKQLQLISDLKLKKIFFVKTIFALQHSKFWRIWILNMKLWGIFFIIKKQHFKNSKKRRIKNETKITNISYQSKLIYVS